MKDHKLENDGVYDWMVDKSKRGANAPARVADPATAKKASGPRQMVFTKCVQSERKQTYMQQI